MSNSRWHNDFVSQQQFIKEALKRFTELLDSRLDHFPREVQIMLRYIHQHLFDKDLTVEKIERACSLRNHNVATKFRHAVGVGPAECISNLRMEAAAFVLLKRKVEINLLADAVGYTEEGFPRRFKKVYGCSPLQYQGVLHQRVIQEERRRENVDKKNDQED
jgi:AraC-like DNA-binding protein